MKLNSIIKSSLLFGCILSIQQVFAQRSYIRNQVKNNVEKKVAEPHKEKGVEAIEKVTYENDTRFNNYKNDHPATLTFQTIYYDKKGAEKNTTKEKMIFGKVGECLVQNNGAKDETWIIYNYKEKANYIVTVKDKSAIKMPLVNAQKMIEKQAKKSQENGTSELKKTDEKRNISGYDCVKYINVSENGATVEMWVTAKPIITVSTNYLLGMQLNQHAGNQTMSAGFGTLIESVVYDKNGKIQMRRTLINASKKSEEQYFDLSTFKINDVVDALR